MSRPAIVVRAQRLSHRTWTTACSAFTAAKRTREARLLLIWLVGFWLFSIVAAILDGSREAAGLVFLVIIPLSVALGLLGLGMGLISYLGSWSALMGGLGLAASELVQELQGRIDYRRGVVALPFDIDLPADLVFLWALGTGPLASVLGLLALPRLDAAAETRSALAERIRLVLASQEIQRLRYRVLEEVLYLPWRLFPWLQIAVGLVLLYSFRPVPGQLAELLTVACALVGLWIGATVAFHKFDRFEPKPIAVGHSDLDELELISRLESGEAFGLYLRPFGAGGIAPTLKGLDGCQFFALQDTRPQSSSLGITEVWVPGRQWRAIAYPLIRWASVVVADVSTVLELRAHPSLLAELSFAVEQGLTGKFVLVGEPAAHRHEGRAALLRLALRFPEWLSGWRPLLGLPVSAVGVDSKAVLACFKHRIPPDPRLVRERVLAVILANSELHESMGFASPPSIPPA